VTGLGLTPTIVIQSGLGSGGVTTYTFDLEDDKVKAVMMRVKYSMPINDGGTREFTDLIRIDRGTTTHADWVVPAPVAGNGTLTITKSRITTTDGPIKDNSDPVTLTGPNILISKDGFSDFS
jgi:hypothetical protein